MKEKLIGNIGRYIIVNVKKTNFLKRTYLLYWSHVFLHRRMKSVVFDWFTSSSKSFQSHIDKKSEIKQNVIILYLLFKNLKNRWYYIYLWLSSNSSYDTIDNHLSRWKGRDRVGNAEIVMDIWEDSWSWDFHNSMNMFVHKILPSALKNKTITCF